MAKKGLDAISVVLAYAELYMTGTQQLSNEHQFDCKALKEDFQDFNKNKYEC